MIGYLKLGAALAVIAALAWLGFIVNGWRDDAARLPVIRAERDQARAGVEVAREQFAKVQEASSGYQAELTTLRDAARRERIPVVRVCRDVPATAEDRLPDSERGPDERATVTGPLPSTPSRDIAPDLFNDADLADELSAQVRGLQAYARGCAAH